MSNQEPFMPIVQVTDETEIKTTLGVLKAKDDEIAWLRSTLVSIMNSCNSTYPPTYAGLSETARRGLEGPAQR